MCIWVGQQSGPALSSIFGVNSPESVDVSMVKITTCTQVSR
jgi:hypothetical protein